jgi:flagellar export protein FliJ
MNADKGNHRLSVLWKVRRQGEDACRMAFESARSQAAAAEVQVRRLRGLLEVHTTAARTAMLNDPAAMARYRQSVAELGAALVDASRFLAEARLELERRRAELEEAVRQRKAAEALRRREAMAEAAAQNRQESRTSEDLHAARQAAEASAPQ